MQISADFTETQRTVRNGVPSKGSSSKKSPNTEPGAGVSEKLVHPRPHTLVPANSSLPHRRHVVLCSPPQAKPPSPHHAPSPSSPSPPSPGNHHAAVSVSFPFLFFFLLKLFTFLPCPPAPQPPSVISASGPPGRSQWDPHFRTRRTVCTPA